MQRPAKPCTPVRFRLQPPFMINLENFISPGINYDPKSVLSLIEDDYHENFGIQWNRFSKLQLDSFNGSSESKDRLDNQSKLDPAYFKDKNVLELGAGNGRFTEILLNYGANVVAVDFSSAIYANFSNHHAYVINRKLFCIRGDLFNLPLIQSSFDIVVCYGVIQHTGNNLLALTTLSRYVIPDGKLLVDIYSHSFKHLNPWIYLIRPFFALIKNESLKLNIVERFVRFIFPLQLFLLSSLHNQKGLLRFLRYFINRSPNSVYGINLYLDNKISKENAINWSICDTYDAWSPKHDHPVSLKRWKNLLSKLTDFKISHVSDCGQGWCATLVKNSAYEKTG